MKIKDGFILSNVAGKNIVVSVGNNDFSGMLTLNETGVFFWNMLQKGTTKEQMLIEIRKEYDVSEREASEDIDYFIRRLSDAKILED